MQRLQELNQKLKSIKDYETLQPAIDVLKQ